MRLLAALLLGLSAGCYAPSIEDGTIPCRDGDQACPDGLRCGGDNLCYRDPPAIDAAVFDAPQVDATSVDARVPEICDNGVDDNDDGKIDCADADCPGVCDDMNACTTDPCTPATGVCNHVDLTGASCGPGCQCTAGIGHETSCLDGADNDRDSLRDCLDTDDCGMCAAGSMCCTADAACHTVCL